MLFQVELTLRYTRISCRPFGASLELSHLLQADDRADALRQGGLCLDRDLEELLARVNTQNVSELLVEVRSAREVSPSDVSGARLWNPEPFSQDLPLPRHIVLKES